MKGSKVVSFGFNSPKTHPRMYEVSQRYNLDKMYKHQEHKHVSYCKHAELDAILKADSDFDTIFVARVSAQGKLVQARPCLLCEKLIEEAGAETVLYTKDNGVIKETV